LRGQGSLFRGIFTLGVAQVISLVGALVVTVLLPRYLGDVNLGKLAFAGALTSLFGLIADLGTMTYLTKQVARDPSQAGRLTVGTILTRIPLGVGAALLAVGVAHITDEDPVTRSIVYVMAIAMILGSLGNTLGAALQGLHRMRALAISMVLGKLAYAGLVAWLLFAGFGVVEVALASLISTVIGAGAAAIMLGRVVTRSPLPNRATLSHVLFGGMPFFVWQASLVVYGQIDFVLLSLMTNDAVVGWYAAAYRIIMIPAFFPTTVVTAALPALSATAHEPAAFRSIAERCVKIVALTTIPMAFGILVIPDKLIDALGYPVTFSHSLVPIVLLALHMPLAGIDMVLGTMLAALDRQRYWAMAGVAAAVLNPSLNLIAIPLTQSLTGNGAIGAAAITTLTELFMFSICLRLMPRGILGWSTASFGLKCVASSALMAGVVWILRDMPLYASVLIGVAVYAVLVVALRVISIAELRDLATFVLRQRAQRRAIAAEPPAA
jgi:O-antigen/teichoic acid export membrane protein